MNQQEFLHLLKEKCIGLTGGIATGKSTVANIIRQEGFSVFDADQLARDIVRPGAEAANQILATFGETFFEPTGTLNRSRLRDWIIEHPSERQKLEQITHPAIWKRFQELAEEARLTPSGPCFFYDAALIFETGKSDLFRETWVTHCSLLTQRDRLKNRSGLGDKEAQKLIDTQMPTDQKIAKANFVIDTEQGIPAVIEVIKEKLRSLR